MSLGISESIWLKCEIKIAYKSTKTYLTEEKFCLVPQFTWELNWMKIYFFYMQILCKKTQYIETSAERK